MSGEPAEKAGPTLHPEEFLEQMTRIGRQEVELCGRLVRRGSRVRLRPRPGGDLIDGTLAGRTAVVEGIDEDDGGALHVAVVVDDDPGRDLGGTRHPAHRFFFAPEELEPMESDESSAVGHRVLVAGIGNLFLGDDGFGVAVAHSLSGRSLPAGVEVVDFGIRGRDLAFALGGEYRAAILVDALPPGGTPGTVVVMEAEDEGGRVPLDGHRMDPVSVLKMARTLGSVPERILVVGCRTGAVGEKWCPESAMRLSEPVASAVERAADLVAELAAEIVEDLERTDP